LGVSQYSRYFWKKKVSKASTGDAEKDAEIRRLKRELLSVTEERDILKKGEPLSAIGPRDNGEGHGTDLQRHPAVVYRAPDRMALHRAGQADARHGFVESFNGRMRDELLNETMFRNLAHARVVIAVWAADFNTERPHSALDYETPAGYARVVSTAIVGPATGDDNSARRAITQPTLIGVNTNRTPVAAG